MGDLLVTCLNEIGLAKFKSIMKNEFEKSYIGKSTYFLGMEFVNTKHEIFLLHKKYAGEILKKFKMNNCNHAITPVETNTKVKKDINDELVNATLYMYIIGSLRYICNSKLYIFQHVGSVSKFLEKLINYHFLKDQVSKERLEIEYYKTKLQLKDILTKPLKGTSKI